MQKGNHANKHHASLPPQVQNENPFKYINQYSCTAPKPSRELLPRKSSRLALLTPMFRRHIKLINILQRQAQEIVLVLPSHLRLSELRALVKSRRGIRDLGNEIRGGCFRDAVHQHADERGFQDYGECKGEAEEYALAVFEPAALLLGGEGDAAEVWFELC